MKAERGREALTEAGRGQEALLEGREDQKSLLESQEGLGRPGEVGRSPGGL